MEKIKQGKILINRGEKLVTIYKKGSTIDEKNEDLWSFIDSLLLKGYKIVNFDANRWGCFVLLTKT